MSKDMKTVKNALFLKYGCICEVCGEKFDKNELTGHHIIMRCKGGKITEQNILITCHHCHFDVINHMKYDSKEYWELMQKSLAHRK